METEVLDSVELAALLEQPKRHTLTGCRNYAMLQLMAQTGIRCNEALQVVEKDIRDEVWGHNGEKVKVRVLRLRKKTTKGKKDRTGIPLNAETLAALAEWIAKRDELGLVGGPLFCTITNGRVAHPSSRGEHGKMVAGAVVETETAAGQKLSSRYVREMVARYAEQAGIGKRVHSHMIRHTALTDLYDRTLDLRLVQTVAGHSSSKTTERYTHVRPMAIAKAMGVVTT